MQNVCSECNTALQGKQEKFCSHNCRQKHWKKNNGKEKYNAWQRNWFRKKARANWSEINCIVCGNKFLPPITHKGQARYCSKKCSAFIVKRVSRQNNRALKLYGITGKITSQDWLDILERDNKTCQICGSKNKIEIDHTIPLSLGGQNSKENLRVSCQHCNRSWSGRNKKIRKKLSVVSHSEHLN